MNKVQEQQLFWCNLKSIERWVIELLAFVVAYYVNMALAYLLGVDISKAVLFVLSDIEVLVSILSMNINCYKNK